MPAPTLTTKRLLLRKWKASDLLFFAKMNQDLRVMEYFPSTLSSQESNQLARTIRKEMEEKPYGLWAVEVKDIAPFIGFVGLHDVTFNASFTPAIEIGWRLDFDYWGKGYAFEAASTVIDYAFNTLKLPKIVSFTATTNTRSIRLMKKLGLKFEKEFDHPKLAVGHPLRKHVLMSLSKKLQKSCQS